MDQFSMKVTHRNLCRKQVTEFVPAKIKITPRNILNKTPKQIFPRTERKHAQEK